MVKFIKHWKSKLIINCWLGCFLAYTSLPISNLWMALISETLVWFGWITSHWVAIMLLFSYIMRLTTFMWCVCWSQQFFIDFRKNMSCNIIQPHSALFDVFGIFFGHQCVIIWRFLKKLKIEGSTIFKGSVVHIRGRMFCSKNLNNH